MTEMVERVAQAMVKADGDNTVMEHHRRRAIAAIKAMREPTEEMMKKCVQTSYSYGGEDGFEYVSDQNSLDFWQAMIDAALTRS